MALQVTGKNVDAGGPYKDYVTDKISNVMEKFVGPELSGHVRLEKERSGFRTDCSIRLRTGLLLEARGAGEDAYASADAAVERLETRVRRYKRRLKSHHNSHRDGQPQDIGFAAREHVVKVDEQQNDDVANESPVIIAENELGLNELSVSEAVMHLDLTENPFLIFRNAGTGNINVVYQRDDGNIGWVDPYTDKAQKVAQSAS